MSTIPQPPAAPQIPPDPGELIYHGGEIAPGLHILLSFDPASGAMYFETRGKLGRVGNDRALAKYRTLRHEFLQRVTAITGKPISIAEYDEHGYLDGVTTVEPPSAGHA